MVLCCAAIFAQSTSTKQKEPSGKEQGLTFQGGVNLVLVPVVVRNKQGQAVGNLTQDEFQIFDRGKRQVIASFSAIKRPTSNHEGKIAPNMQAGVSTSENPAGGNGPSHFESAAAADAHAAPERFLVYLFDDLDANSADMAAVRSAVSRHLRSLASTDRAAIYTFSGRPQIDFTGDKEKLEDAAAKLRSSLSDVLSDDAKECPNINYYLADLIANRGDQNARNAAVSHTIACAHVDRFTAESIVSGAAQRQLVFGPQESRMALRTLRLAIKRLAEMPGERLIILTSPGFHAQTPDAITDTEQLLKLAAKAHITISALSSRGLYTNQPDASDSRATNKLWWEYQRQSSESDEGIMQDLAQGSGGVFIHNNDDLRAAFDRLAKPPEVSYVLGFQPINSKPDGEFHAIKIRLPNEKGLTIEARRGYYAPERDAGKQAARLEVDDAVFSRDQINQIPVVLQTGYIKPNEGDPMVTVIVKVDMKSLRFRIANGRNLDSLTVVSALFDDDGGYLTGSTKTVNLQLRDETLAHSDSSVTLRFAFHVKRGAYLVRVVVRDAQSGAMTTFTRPETIT